MKHEEITERIIGVGWLLNFGPKSEFRRKVMETARKSRLESVVVIPESS